MSVEELKLTDDYERGLYFTVFAGQICVTPIVHRKGDTITLDRSQVHLLMLYLQEHLKKLKLAKLSFWYCSRCNKYHDANYVCVML